MYVKTQQFLLYHAFYQNELREIVFLSVIEMGVLSVIMLHT